MNKPLFGGSDLIIQPERILMLNTIPLTKGRFYHDKRWTWLYNFIRKPKDFIKTRCDEGIDNWNTYQLLIKPIINKLHVLCKESKASVKYDVPYKQFKKHILEGKYDAIFIAAHMINIKNCIEFSDGGKPLNEILNFLSSINIDRKIAILFCVCESDIIHDWKIHQINNISVAMAFWNVDVNQGIEFIKLWIFEINGIKTLNECYSLAISKQLEKWTN